MTHQAPDGGTPSSIYDFKNPNRNKHAENDQTDVGKRQTPTFAPYPGIVTHLYRL